MHTTLRKPAAAVLVAVLFVPTVALAAPAPAPAPATIAEILSAGTLRQTTNPVLAGFVVEEGAATLSEEQRAEAIDQLRDALKSQTNVIALFMQGTMGMMNSPAMRQMQEQAKKMSGPGTMAKAYMGIGPSMPKMDPNQMEREMQQGMVDPWVRAIAAADALARSGDANAAGRFYVNCLKFLPSKWVPDACLDGAVGLGAKRAFTLFDWMWREAESITAGPLQGMGAAFGDLDDSARGGRGEKPEVDPGVIQVRNAALEGLGVLVGTGALAPESKEKAMATLLGAATAKGNEAYFQGAAEGLGRSKDPRAVEPLRRIAKQRSDPDAKQAAQRALVIGFADEAARKQLRGELDDKDPEEQLRAAQALYEAGDAAAFQWAVDVITQRRTTEAKKPDIRALVVRDLVELGGPRARQTLAQALAEGPGNDWLAAWVRIALLELGDAGQLPAIEAALAKEDWALDPRGFRSVWRALKPFLMAAATTILTGGLAAPTVLQQVRQATSLVGNFIAGERSRYLTKVNQREALTAQLRWQTADALVAAHPPGSARLLARLLDDPNPPVRLSAALAFARLDQPDAFDGIVRAFALDYGAEDGVSRTPEVRASLLRAALLRNRQDPRTVKLVQSARADADTAVRFIGLAAAQPAV